MNLLLRRIYIFGKRILEKGRGVLHGVPNIERSVVLCPKQDVELQKHLLRIDGQEDICFALYKENTGIKRKNFVVYKVILPQDDDREVHGNVSVYERFLERCLKMAKEEQSGLAILHSHPPQAIGWQEMSSDDFDLEKSYSGRVKGTTGKFLVGMTIAGGDKTWSGRIWEKFGNEFKPKQVTNIRTIRENALVIKVHPALVKKYNSQDNQKRTIEAWSESVQEKLINIRVGILGLGSVGSVVTELLARIGVTDFVLIDYDLLEEKNLDRHISSTKKDIGKIKTNIVRNRVKVVATGKDAVIECINRKLIDSNSIPELLDCDVIFCCADTNVGRHVVNIASFQHCIPVIEGGVKIETSSGNMKSITTTSRLLTGNKRCLECQGQYSISKVNNAYDQQEYINGDDIDGISAAPYSFLAGTLQVNHFISLISGNLSLRNNNIVSVSINEKKGVFKEENDKSCNLSCAIKDRKIIPN